MLDLDNGVCDTSMSPVFTAMAVALPKLSMMFAADMEGKALPASGCDVKPSRRT